METFRRESHEDAEFTPICGRSSVVKGFSGAEQSLVEALSGFDEKRQIKSAAKMKALLQQLANGDQLRCPKQFRKEGSLPGNAGHFFAVKLVGSVNIRAYIFKIGHVWWISHFINKKKDDLDPVDTIKVQNCYRVIRGNN